jgi:hypothetical protein
MTRNIHDSFAKDWMREFLTDFGTVETEYEISSEVRHVDVYFNPNPDLLPAPMGLFGRMITQPCLIEPFRNAIPEAEIGNCKAKSIILGLNLIRQAKAEKRKFRFRHRPFLWMLTPTLSKAMQRTAQAIEHPDWEQGIYQLSDLDRCAIIAIHQLPATLDTLWLRLLGRDTVQKQAIAELLALPKDHPYRATTLRHIAVLQRNLKSRQNITRDLREVIMTLSITYEQIEAEIIEKGLHQGREEGREEGREATQQSIARKMLQEGMNPKTVARLTGVPLEELPTISTTD